VRPDGIADWKKLSRVSGVWGINLSIEIEEMKKIFFSMAL